MRIPYLIIGPAGFSLAILRGHDGLHENMPELADVPTIIEARDIETTIDTTPAASASISNTASSDYITRVCQNTDQDGPCAEIVDANECSILPDGVAHQVRNFYQASGWVCRYFDSTCNDPKGVITIDSHDGLYHVDLPPEAAAMIGMVVCAKNWFGAPPGAASEVQAKATITKAGASSTIKARGNEASVPGTIVLCQNTIDNGPCERVQAQNRCVAFGDATSHKVRSVYQPQGFNCNYFESDCSSHTAVVSITSHKQDTIVQLDPSVGGKIGLVLCQASRPIAELGVAYSSIEAHSGPVEARNNEIATSCPGDVRVCNTQGGAGACVRLRALNRCKRFPVGFAHQAEVVTQAAHSACTYYSENCESQHFSYEQQAGDQINELRGDLKIWGAVFCHEVPSPSARSIEAHQNDSQPASQPGDVTVCNKQQPCVYIHALNSCKHIYVDIFQPPEIIHQAGGVLCKYYRHTQCQAQYYLFEEISGEGDLAITGDVLHKILAVICMNADSAGLPEDATVDTAALFGSDNSGDRELDPPASNPLHTRNNDASHAPVQVRRSLGRMMIWDAPNFPSGHGTAGPYESCTNAPFTVKSLYIAKGSRCVLYSFQGCNTYQLWYGSDSHDFQIADLGLGVKSFRCQDASLPEKAASSDATNADMAPAPIEARAHHDHAAGETTVCHLKNFGACHDNLINAMDRCANFDPGYGFPSSLMQYQGVFCKWYRDFGCSGRGDAMVIDSRGETVKMGDLGADDSMFRSVRCQDSPW